MAGSNFVDYVKIFARSGHGGSGSAHFRREKFVEFGGPDGGDGGRGGHIILRGDSQYWTLIHLKYQRHQFAEDGEGGSGARSSGKNGKDIVIPVPLGTVARRVLEDGTTEYAGEVTPTAKSSSCSRAAGADWETGISRPRPTRLRVTRSLARIVRRELSFSN